MGEKGLRFIHPDSRIGPGLIRKLCQATGVIPSICLKGEPTKIQGEFAYYLPLGNVIYSPRFVKRAAIKEIEGIVSAEIVDLVKYL